jgi:CheY-like chemotaxis protein
VPSVCKVLVVDDNADSADMLAALVEARGYLARAAHDGESALAHARDFMPDVAFVDIGLPDIDGFEVARRLRAEPTLARIKLVALTGYGTDDDRAQTAEAGFDRHVVKPIDLATLDRVLGELCR